MSTDIRTSPVSSLSFVDPESGIADQIAEFVRRDIDLDQQASAAPANEFWRHFTDLGTELWLDTGDVDAINGLWNASFSGLTTNNTLLNQEVQEGTYDELIPQADKVLRSADGLDDTARIREVGFALNLRHALRLVEKFRCQVSVELHTDLAHDVQASLAYARRCHAVCPEFFVVKVPLTPAGLIVTKQLSSEGIRVNCTLGFSARQNYVVTALANPAYVNVFLGRLNSYVADNQLGSGELVGEKTALASQQEVSIFARGLPTNNTKQIAASLRDAQQLPRLAGIDVFTMPPKVAEPAPSEIDAGGLRSRLNDDLDVELHPDVDPNAVRAEKLWNVRGQERDFVQKLILNPPSEVADLTAAVERHGLRDLFPEWSEDDLRAIAEDGKIPRHDKWKQRIVEETVAIDSLMNAAGLASFAASQAELDDRIRRTL